MLILSVTYRGSPRQANHYLPINLFFRPEVKDAIRGNDSNLLIVFYVQIMPDDFVMQLHRF
ncbi:aldehyde dehydrogenase [Citrobacter freundii complex sp. CFNIH11]|nr:aldehyde dehydrogenase [Citrobacter freundii]POV62777.1 aldehyde dehydrogenase [Citrobacter freundii complex sp. CFNIH11]